MVVRCTLQHTSGCVPSSSAVRLLEAASTKRSKIPHTLLNSLSNVVRFNPTTKQLRTWLSTHNVKLNNDSAQVLCNLKLLVRREQGRGTIDMTNLSQQCDDLSEDDINDLFRDEFKRQNKDQGSSEICVLLEHLCQNSKGQLEGFDYRVEVDKTTNVVRSLIWQTGRMRARTLRNGEMLFFDGKERVNREKLQHTPFQRVKKLSAKALEASSPLQTAMPYERNTMLKKSLGGVAEDLN